jgi:hypothetical protein
VPVVVTVLKDEPLAAHPKQNCSSRRSRYQHTRDQTHNAACSTVQKGERAWTGW